MKIGLARLAWGVLGILLTASSAFAQGVPPAPAPAVPPTAQVPYPPPPPEPPLPTASITVSPVHLFLPVLELTGEFRVAPKIGVAGILGGGSMKVTDSFQTVKVSIFEAGGSFRYYVLGDFRHGMQVGAELLYIHLSGATRTESAVVGGAALGPFVGYKIATSVGFTFEGQLGYQRVLYRGSSSNGTTASDSGNIVLLNLNVGWSI